MEKVYFYIKEYFRWHFLFFLAITSFLLWQYSLDISKTDKLKFVVLDVGQGDSLYIKSPTGVEVLVDGGRGNSLLKVISNVIPWYDREVDMIVVTNPDSDHYEGFIKFLDKYKVSNILESGTVNSSPVYSVFEQKIREKNINKILAINNQIIDLGGGVYLQVLFPDRDVSGLSANDGSIVMKLVYGDTSVMLQGDSTSRIEQFLLSNVASSTLKSDILKVGHHGSRTSSYVGYIKAVSPKWAVISSGKNNDYGHPHKEVLETIDRLGIPTFSTCNNGSIFFESDGKNFSLLNKKMSKVLAGCKID